MELRITNNDCEFHGRACGIIKQQDKFLIMRVNDAEYYHIPGGHIEIGEDSGHAVVREIKEELGCEIKDYELFAIQENFWVRAGKQCHGIEFYYIVSPLQEMCMQDNKIVENDNGKITTLHTKWVTANELQQIDLRPNNIRNMLISGQYRNGLAHIINRTN